MFNLLDCSAFETSTSVQAINDILFPVVLFIVIFRLMCEIFLIDVVVEGNLPVDEEFSNGIAQIQTDKDTAFQEPEDNHTLKNSLVNMATTTDEYKTKTELYNVDTGHQNMKALGIRKLRDFCRNSKIKGYASAYNRRGLDGLVKFLLAKQIYAHQIEQ